MNDFSLTNTTFVSGQFCDPKIVAASDLSDFSSENAGPPSIYNPALIESARNLYSQTPASKVAERVISRLEKKEYVIHEEGLADYSRILQSLAFDLQLTSSDCYLAPLRGARFPALFTQVMTNRIQFESFDYKEGADRVENKDPRIRADLSAIIARRNGDKETFTITAVDVVKGGWGMPALVDLLEELKLAHAVYRPQAWHVDLRMLHSTPLTDRLHSLEHRSNANITVHPKFYHVSDTLVEDFDAALGFVIQGKGTPVKFLKPAAIEGQFLYKNGADVSLIESSDLFVTMQDFIANKVTTDMTTNPDLIQIGNLWKDYVNKG